MCIQGRTPCVPTQYHPQISFRRFATINKSTPRRLHDTLQPARLPIEAIMLSEDAAGRRAARLPIEAMILSDDVAGRRALPLPLPILHTQNTDSATPPYYTSTARRCRRRRCGGRLP